MTHVDDAELALGVPKVRVNEAWCKHCYICVSVCPRGVLTLDESRLVGGYRPVVVKDDDARCTGCRNCELLCPDLAIQVDVPESSRS
jgi:2-oxoglutarate ferredoxin oxidoreductase subunit delta